MKNTQFKEMLYADFLLNLFDADCDGSLGREEFANMLRVLLGREPSARILRSISPKGMTRDELVKRLHILRCDITQLDSDRATAKSWSTVVIVVGCVVALGAVLYMKQRN